MSRPRIYDKIAKSLFAEKGSVALSTQEELVKKRLMVAFVKKTDDPVISDKDLVRLLMNTFDISERQAYIDINHVEIIFGDFRRANKEYIRHIVNETQKKVIKHEQDRLKENSKLSSKSLSYAILVLAKANGLDKEDPNLPDWESIQPPVIEATDDITVLDLENIEDETVEKIRRKYLVKKKDIQDAEIIE